MAERGRANKSILVIVLGLLLLLAILSAVFAFMRGDNDPFDENDEEFYYYFANTTEEERCEVYSLDAYYLPEGKEYFYNVKYALRIEGEEEWSDVDKVLYGIRGTFSSYFCLNWDNLDGYEDANERFERAQKEGVHKTYTLEEIEKGIASAREEIAREEMGE